jgi:uncharacterized protein (DUF2126 family)
VVAYIKSNGFDFKLEWLDSFFEFRFPILGTVLVKDMRLTLRAGIEPWNVLGEEMSNTGTARFVDSSVERLEVLIDEFSVERYKLLCNRVVVPMVATSTKGKYVASIRYKAWNPPSALHPTVGVDTPLVFDIYDTWNKCVIGGCTYHVSHPGGRSYDTFPVNSYAAEGRRISRFWDYNHSTAISAILNQQTTNPRTSRGVSLTEHAASDFVLFEAPINEDYPNTLDLRKIKK